MPTNPIDLNKIKNAKTESKTEGTSAEGADIISSDGKRSENEKSNLHNIKMCLFWIAGGLIVCMAIITAWHTLMPISCRWLSIEESSSLQKMFMTGVGAGLVGKFGNKLAP